ncbi:MAG TPA: hypothetical protein VIG33_02655, partial [Pseudobdellovibrionaceae bacterium]|jgi:hypothetical protein
VLLPFNLEFRYERDASQQTVDRRPKNFAIGAGTVASTILFEYSAFNENTGNKTLSLARTHQEYSFWWKEKFMNLEFLDAFFSGGVGGYEEKVTTTLSGAGSATDSSGLQALAGASVGLQSLMFNYVLVSIEGRLIAGKNFDPNPQGGILLRLGAEF